MKLTNTRLVGAGVLAALTMAGATGGSIAAAAGGTNTVTIDAAKDPTGAAKAMDLFPTSTDQSFTATVPNPTYTTTDWQVASKFSINNPPGSDHDASQVLESTHKSDFGWSIGGSVEAGTTLSALGFANAKVSVKFSAEHQWTTGTTDSEEVEATAGPGKVVWIVASNRQATFTGDYTFTANGTTYQVNNVTITEPAPAPGGAIGTGVTYMAVEQPYSTVYNPKTLIGRSQPSGAVPVSNTPQLAQLTSQLPKLP